MLLLQKFLHNEIDKIMFNKIDYFPPSQIPYVD